MILLYAYLSSLSTNISQTAHTTVSLLTCKMCYAVFASKNRAFDKSNFVCCRFLAETNSKTDLPIKRRFRYFQHSTQKRFTTSSKTEKAYGVPLQSKNRTAHFYTCLYHCIIVASSVFVFPKYKGRTYSPPKAAKCEKKDCPERQSLKKSRYPCMIFSVQNGKYESSCEDNSINPSEGTTPFSAKDFKAE